MCLVAGLRPDPLGELTAGLRGRGVGKRKGRERRGKKERGGPPMSEVH